MAFRLPESRNPLSGARSSQRRVELPTLQLVLCALCLGMVASLAGCGNSEDEAETSAASTPSQNFTEIAWTSSTQELSDDVPAGQKLAHPFERRIDFPFDFPEDADWLNTSGRIRMQDLKGKFVIMDFWTYCCINCMHVLPELKKIEEKYPDQVVVIGVHSAKFDTEKDTQNIKDAIMRYEIEHPVINDGDMAIWRGIGISAWPTLLMIDPAGQAVWLKSGETKFELLDEVLSGAIPYYKQEGLLDETPLRFELHSMTAPPTPLRFPGKILADEASNRLFIADSNHNRIVIADLDGNLIDIIGSGQPGWLDGGFAECQFDHPQGMVLQGETLYIADTENHLLRKVNLSEKSVATIAGDGKQGEYAFPGMDQVGPLGQLPDRWVGKPLETGISSPWALWIHESDLYIAMAGPHQIWKMPLDESEIYPYAGNGREDIVDGPLLPARPYSLGFSSFAQPSGLAADGEWLYVADSEGSSIRAVPFDETKEVRTVVGTADLPNNRLFTFGDVDGEKDDVLLQHVIGVAYADNFLYVTDTYNNKIKIIDAKSGATSTLAGTGDSGASDEPTQFDEPAGLSIAGDTIYVADTNNHLIRTVDRKSGATATLEIKGLKPPTPPAGPARPTFETAKKLKLDAQAVQTSDGFVEFEVRFNLPPLWKINPVAPQTYYVDPANDAGVVDSAKLDGESIAIEPPSDSFRVKVPVTGDGEGRVKVSCNFFYCQEGGEGLCKVGSVVWTVPFSTSEDAEEKLGTIEIDVDPTGF